MSRAAIDDLASCLLADMDALSPWRSLASPQDLTRAHAYALQNEVVRLRKARGERVIGYKIGCASRVIQAQLGIDEPIVGRLFDTGCYRAGSRLSHARFANLAVEGELAIRLSRELPGRPLSNEDYAGAIESVFPVIELHHYVLPAEGGSAAALVVSNAMHAGLVLAEQHRPCPAQVSTVRDLSILFDGRVVGKSTEPWTMDGPAATLRWLSAHLAGWGEHLVPGLVILTGSVLPLFPVIPGTRIVVEAGPLGRSLAEIDR